MSSPFSFLSRWIIGFAILLLFISSIPVDDWGFFGHRRINRLAVFTLPMELIPLYKHHIEYITEHAVDPDMRRYASKHEAGRHYIDVDHWGTYPFDNVPRTWSKALQKYTEFYGVLANGDTLQLVDYQSSSFSEEAMVWRGPALAELTTQENLEIDAKRYGDFFRNNVLPQYYEEQWKISLDSLRALIAPAELSAKVVKIKAVDRFSEYGILPYHLVQMQRRLTKAFAAKDGRRILQLSSEMGHYLGDAHVPLHTTENYNGQLTNQVGIHAFWESRIPELFADEEFDYFVGKAIYIDNPVNYYWDIVLKSHTYVDSLLAYERQLKATFSTDQQYCYETRNGKTVRQECREFAAAYQALLGDQVEQRMRGAIHAVGSAWYTSWVDAGQPDVSAIFDLPEGQISTEVEEKQLSEKEKKKIRDHQ